MHKKIEQLDFIEEEGQGSIAPQNLLRPEKRGFVEDNVPGSVALLKLVNRERYGLIGRDSVTLAVHVHRGLTKDAAHATSSG